MSEPAPFPDDRPRAPTVRSRLMLEVASELVGLPDWDAKQARIQLRIQGPNPWEVGLLASDGPSGVTDVMAGDAAFAIINPAGAAPSAAARAGFEPHDLAAIATVPSYDQLGLAIHSSFGIRSLEDLAEKRPPLRVSLRGQRDHSVHQVVDDVLASIGISLADVKAWGGQVLYQEGLPHRAPRKTAMADGTIDAVFDEGIYNWVDLATDAGMRFIPIEGAALQALEAKGYRRSALTIDRFPSLPADVTTLDFSGFMIYTRSNAAESLVRMFCVALERRSDRIPWQGGPSLPLARMVSDAVDAPLTLSLHPAAAEHWRQSGILGSGVP